MQRLSGVDAGFLYAETAAWHMHVGAVLVLDPSTAPTPFGVDTLRSLIRRRLPDLGLFRYRVRTPLPGMGRPRWVEVPDVDLDWHVRTASLPAPGGMEELAGFAADVLSRKLDRRRPLWEFWLLDGLADGRTAIVIKVHHACVDGVRSMQLYGALFDLAPDAPFERVHRGAAAPEPPPTRAHWARATAADVAGLPMRGARALRTVAGAGLHLADFVRSPAGRHTTLPFTAPRSPFNGTLTAARSVALCSLPMPEVRAVRAAHDVTVNDVVLAVCTGALRRYLLAAGVSPERPLVVQMPVGVHKEVERSEATAVPGNFVSAMGALLPVHLEDAVDQLYAIRASTRAAKSMHGALGEDFLLDVLDAVPPVAIAGLVGAYTHLHLEHVHPPIFNVLVSNVQGSPVPLYLAGAHLLGTYALGPILAGSGLNITVASYVDELHAGVVGCPDVVSGVREIAAAMPEALHELSAARSLV